MLEGWREGPRMDGVNDDGSIVNWCTNAGGMERKTWRDGKNDGGRIGRLLVGVMGGSSMDIRRIRREAEEWHRDHWGSW